MLSFCCASCAHAILGHALILVIPAGTSRDGRFSDTVPHHYRCHTVDLQDRRVQSLLQGIIAVFDGRQPCGCSVPLVRAGQVMGRYVAHVSWLALHWARRYTDPFAVDPGNGDHSSLSPGTILACSAFSKMIASLATYPHEVLRTRLQIRKSEASGGSNKPHSGLSSSTSSSNSPQKSSLHPQSKPTPAPSSNPLLSHGQFHSPLVTGNQPPHPISVPAGPSMSNPLPNPLPRIELPKPPWYKQIAQSPRPGGVVDTFLAIKRQDGWRGFYRGLSINLIRTVPNSAVTMLT